MIRHRAYIYREPRSRRLAWSGFCASGDPGTRRPRSCDADGERHAADQVPYPLAYVVEVGREFVVTGDEPARLYLTGPGKGQFTEWTADALVNAARLGWFGFRLAYREGDR